MLSSPMLYASMDDFVSQAVAVEYAERIASQRRAVLQRLASKRGLQPDAASDEWALVDDISHRSHALYRSGCSLLISPSLGTSIEACEKQEFEHILDMLLQDVVAFDMMMAHWRAEASESSSSSAFVGLATDVMTCYSHAAVAMVPLRGGASGGALGVVESWKRLRTSLKVLDSQTR